MPKYAHIIVASCLILVSACSSSRNKNPDGVLIVRSTELTRGALPAKYENQKVSFQALFEEIVSSRDWEGLEQFKNTHFLISLMTQDKKKRLIEILVPAQEKSLVQLRFGDLLTVTGVVKSQNDHVFVVADSLKKI